MCDKIYLNKYLKYKNKYLELKNSQITQINMTGGSGNKIEDGLYLFKAEWCGHCINFKNTWNNLKKEIGNKITMKEYDADEDKNIMKDFKIEGFPTIILIKDGKAVEYAGGDRSGDSIKTFLTSYEVKL